MRGSEIRSDSLFSYVDLEARVPAKHPLRAIRTIVDDALMVLSADFDAMYSPIGRPSIPPEQLLRALLLQAFYTVRSERQLMEQLDYNLLFRWFTGLGIDDPVWDVTVFTKNRDRLLDGEIAGKFFAAVLNHARLNGFLSDEHFSVDGTLIQAWASMKSFRPKDGSGKPPDPAPSRNSIVLKYLTFRVHGGSILCMLMWATLLVRWLRSCCRSRHELALENLALRQQLAMMKRRSKRICPTRGDRFFWIVFVRFIEGWRKLLVALHPDTVVRWHRDGFRRHWTRKSRRIGRPSIDKELRKLIREMQAANTCWGAPRIHGELLKLGFQISQATVSKYMARHPKSPSQSWRTFLNNHLWDMAAIDFFTVPTATFRILYVFVVLRHDRRRILHVNVTAHPTSSWTAQQLIEAFPFDTAPDFVLRDRDGTYGKTFRRRVAGMGIEEVLIAPRSPWQNPYVERVIGSIRRDCLDHVIVVNERHLRRILSRYLDYYHGSRTHLSLAKDTPATRPISAQRGNVIPFPKVGGLHHHYERIAA